MVSILMAWAGPTLILVSKDTVKNTMCYGKKGEMSTKHSCKRTAWEQDNISLPDNCITIQSQQE